MAQTRLDKVGSIYSRLSGLHKTGAADYAKRPLWFDIYEAFPPKYEPRWDRHLLSYGQGSNVKALGPPRKIFYTEDKVRAQFYKVFFAEDLAKQNQPSKSTERFPPVYNETFNLLQNKDCMAQVFIRKYQEIEAKGDVPSDGNLFKATIEALELDGIHLLNPEKAGKQEEIDMDDDDSSEAKSKSIRLSLKDLFVLEKERLAKQQGPNTE